MKYIIKQTRTENYLGMNIKKVITFIDKTEFIYEFLPTDDGYEESYIIIEPNNLSNEVDKEYFQKVLNAKIKE
jgi:hypothetical protein